MKTLQLILLGFLALFLAAGVKPTWQQFQPDENLIENPGMEYGIAKWSKTGSSTINLNTTAANVGSGTTALAFDAGAGADTLVSTQVTIPAGFYGNQCKASFWYKGGDANLTAEVIDGVPAVKGSQVLAVQATYAKVNIDFICPSSGTIGFRITASADAAVVYLDNVFVGHRWVEPMIDKMTTRGDFIYRNASNLNDRFAVCPLNELIISDGTDPSCGPITSSMIDNGTIADADISGTAGINATKLGLGNTTNAELDQLQDNTFDAVVTSPNGFVINDQTLYDYIAGSFTPTAACVTNCSGTPTTTNPRLTKIGNLVVGWSRVDANFTGTSGQTLAFEISTPYTQASINNIGGNCYRTANPADRAPLVQGSTADDIKCSITVNASSGVKAFILAFTFYTND